MRVYEILFIVAPNTEEDAVQALITQLSDVITSQGAQVTNVNRMGLRRLAYPIQKFREGHYIVLTVEGSGAEIAELERRMRVLDAVVRYLTIRIDEDLKRAEKFKAARGGIANAQQAIDYVLRNLPEVDPNRLYAMGAGSGGSVALCLAAFMGASRIGLIGVDFTDHHLANTETKMKRIDGEYRTLGESLKEKGIEIVNLSADSRLTTFPKISIEEFLR